MRGRSALFVVLVMICSGCWAQFRGDAAHTGVQPLEFTVGPGNVGSLNPTWSATIGGLNQTAPVVAAGTVFVGSDDHKLYAYDAAGAKNCVPGSCQPIWTATTGNVVSATPAVAGGVVYVGSVDHKVYAFSADGSTNCSGTPTVCTPLWTAAVGYQISAVAVANGVVFATASVGKVFAIDAAGVTNCTGAPLVCKPLWSTAGGPILVNTPAVANGVVYATSSDAKLYAYDAAGATACTGTTTRTCKPLWSATVGGAANQAPAVADGHVYVPGGIGGLQAFDAAGTTNCSGTPKTCTPVWTSAGPSYVAPALASGIVYGDVGGTLAAFDSRGVTNCSGSPAVCTPLWSAAAGTTTSPVVANGVVYGGADNGDLGAFDATGTTNCTGTPTVCTPLWTAGGVPGSGLAIVNGTIYTLSQSKMHAYRPCSNPVAAIGWAPCELRDAYQLPSLTGGQGKTVAIVDANHDPNAYSDLAVYRRTFGLEPCDLGGGCFRQVNQLGQNTNYPPADPGWSVEISLDLDMVSAVCPRCKILLIEAPNTLSDITTAEDTAVALGADVISNSYGTNETFNINVNDVHYTHPGVPIVASSGDGGYAAGPQYPAVVPGVTAVGGTTLERAATPRGWTESVWADGININEAGSGCAHYEAKPSWQTDTECTQRTVADVAAVASNLAVYDTYGGPPGWITVGGTSASAPIVAAIYALAHGTTGVADLYSHPTLLHDVTTGSNGSCNSSYLCTAVPGYDGPTGLGTPCGTQAFGPAFTSPTNCNTPPPVSAALLNPAARLARPAMTTPACRTAPPGGVRCLSYVSADHPTRSP